MLNLRGMKEAIKVLLPIFLGFVVIHVFLIVYGIYAPRRPAAGADARYHRRNRRPAHATWAGCS